MFSELNPHKVGNGDQHRANGNQQGVVGYEIRINHQRDATNQRHRDLLFSPINKKSESDGTEDEAEQKS